MKFLVALLCYSALVASAGTIYKTVDANGKTIYTDQAPEPGKISKTFSFADLPSTPIPTAGRSQDARDAGTKPRNPNNQDGAQPILFSADWCGYCVKAKAYLAEKRIRYREYDIDTPEGSRAFSEAGAGKNIPVLMRGGNIQRGFSRNGYDTFFQN